MSCSKDLMPKPQCDGQGNGSSRLGATWHVSGHCLQPASCLAHLFRPSPGPVLNSEALCELGVLLLSVCFWGYSSWDIIQEPLILLSCSS